ncbi:MAG: SpoIID/LytB domain-containing protein [Eubacteriales bacterium]|nr:SpoIID/LytB domain-containing protein [Eubacteriales bacterium]
MKKILFLCGCLAALLLAGLADARIQKSKEVWSELEGEKNGLNELNVEEADGQSAREASAGEDAQKDAGAREASADGKAREDAGAREAKKTQTDENVPRKIRVLIKTDRYEDKYHRTVTLTSDSDYTVSNGRETWECCAGEESVFTMDSGEFSENETLYLSAQQGSFLLPELVRDRKSTLYEGEMEIHRTREGLLLINELPLETYLCGVVPSEMPSNYPAEALKAQAVCARTYARKQMQEGRASEFFADVDDSVSYQVYNNQDRTEETDKAVRETAGDVLMDENGLVEALYYSTSCGLDAGIDLSKETIFAAFITENNLKAYETGEPWYRWQTDIALEALEDVSGLQIRERLPNGAVNRLEVIGEDGEVKKVCEGEYSVREYLAGAHPVVLLQNGETAKDMGLLPSAFFLMQPRYENGNLQGYHIVGGGYGHGNGMSQNGAKHMALEGLDYTQILEKYYAGAWIAQG